MTGYRVGYLAAPPVVIKVRREDGHRHTAIRNIHNEGL